MQGSLRPASGFSSITSELMNITLSFSAQVIEQVIPRHWMILGIFLSRTLVVTDFSNLPSWLEIAMDSTSNELKARRVEQPWSALGETQCGFEGLALTHPTQNIAPNAFSVAVGAMRLCKPRSCAKRAGGCRRSVSRRESVSGLSPSTSLNSPSKPRNPHKLGADLYSTSSTSVATRRPRISR